MAQNLRYKNKRMTKPPVSNFELPESKTTHAITDQQFEQEHLHEFIQENFCKLAGQFLNLCDPPLPAQPRLRRLDFPDIPTRIGLKATAITTKEEFASLTTKLF